MRRLVAGSDRTSCVQRVALVLALVCAWTIGGSARAEYILLPSTDTAFAGGPLSVFLMIANESEQPREMEVPARLDVRITADGKAFNTVLHADPVPSAPRIELAPESFRKIRYSGQLPAAALGSLTIRPIDIPANAIVVSATKGPEPASGTVIAQEPAVAASAPTHRFLSALSTYDPAYVAVGSRGGTNAKFQFSFKFQFFTREASLARYAPFLEELYFGYTQTSIWDLDAPSQPFRDTSYKPKLFYLNNDVWDADEHPIQVGIEAGIGHESNGKGGPDSRGINIVYAKPIVTFGDRAGWHLTVAPMLLNYLSTEGNPDIANYRGYVDLYLSFGKEDRWQLSGLLRNGSHGFSHDVQFSYPLRIVALGNLNGYLLIEYFNGYGESILAYNVREPVQVRLGLMIVR